MSALLEISHVAKSFDRRPVLDDITLSLGAAEAVALIGVNGAGKTTLIRGVLDLSRIDRGTITIAGIPQVATAARQHLCYLAERFTPPHFATGFEYLRHAMALHGLPFDRALAVAEARALDLDPAALSRPAREYSKGMAQKLGLIACILPGAPLLILDEPMSGLDPRARAQFKQRLGALKAEGVALFFSTHLLADVDPLCDRIALLHTGRIVWDGQPAALIAEMSADSLEQAFLKRIGNGP